MCGIIGAVAKRDVAKILLESLTHLEYRGYDSAGIAIIDENEHLDRVRTAGKVNDLEKLIAKKSPKGKTGIGHTRWATHGKPSEINAHPHIAGNEIAIVHNGIIENHAELRADLIKQGCNILSDTDSELIAHLVYLKICEGQDFSDAVKSLSHVLKGAYAIGIIRSKEPGRLFALRRGSPLLIGLGKNETFICSDTIGLHSLVDNVIYLDEGDIADIKGETLTIYNADGKIVSREPHHFEKNKMETNKGNYTHYMLKEIFEQPGAISRTLQDRISDTEVFTKSFGAKAEKILPRIKRIQIVACGTSYHAGLVAKHWIEELAHLPTQVDIASEYRYRMHIVEPDTLFISLSQSGETADTLAALRLANEKKYASTLTFCNVPDSSIVRESELVLLLDAGPEIGVASTKAFTCQLSALLMLAILLGQQRKTLENEAQLIHELKSIPTMIEQALKLDGVIKNISHVLADKENALFIARGIQYPIAMEGALKLKEISYIHAESYPAGELKHGPIALINSQMPVIALAYNDELLEKLKSNLEEIKARDGKIILFTDENTKIDNQKGMEIIRLPSVSRLISPIIYSIPMQLLAYDAAVMKGTNIDQPRNLAKSVTVE